MSQSTVFEHVSNVANNAGLNDDYAYTYASILAGIIKENHSIDDFDDATILEALEDIALNHSDDFTLDFDGNEYRIIQADSISDIYVQAIKDIVTECYDLKLDKLPDFIALSIDWEKTAQNAYVDGYGHTFASYDGNEIEIATSGRVQYHVFRIN